MPILYHYFPLFFIFWTSWLVVTNMTPFAMTFHNRLQAAERMRETSCLCAKTVATVSRLVLLSAGLFALHCRLARLQTCCFSLFAVRLFLRLNQKSPFAPREVSRCRYLSAIYFSLAAVQVSLASYPYCLFSFAFPAP